MSLRIKDIPLLKKLIHEYSNQNIKLEQTAKKIKVDTLLHAHERNQKTLAPLDHMEPFGNSNEEPIFALQNTIIKSIEKVGNRGK